MATKNEEQDERAFLESLKHPLVESIRKSGARVFQFVDTWREAFARMDEDVRRLDPSYDPNDPNRQWRMMVAVCKATGVQPSEWKRISLADACKLVAAAAAGNANPKPPHGKKKQRHKGGVKATMIKISEQLGRGTFRSNKQLAEDAKVPLRTFYRHKAKSRQVKAIIHQMAEPRNADPNAYKHIRHIADD